MSSNLGVSWSHIGSNVPSGRYYWRRLDADIEGDLTTVYFEQKTSKQSKKLNSVNCASFHRQVILLIFKLSKDTKFNK